MKSFHQTAARAARFTIGALLCAASPGLSAGADQNPKKVYELPGIVVVADLAETPLDQTGSSVTVITRADIERSQKATVLELLRQTPGLDVVQSGGPGGQTSVFMRGGASEHTLVLIDGVEMNDPSSPNGAYDFAQLGADNIERIEILRGSQSVLYGSDAIAGVISIITRDSKGQSQASFVAELGSFNTKRASAFVSSTRERVSYTLSASRFETDGISATTVSGAGISEDDSFARTSISGRMRYSVSPSVTASLSLRALESETELDKGFLLMPPGGVREDPNFTSRGRQFFLQSAVEYVAPGSSWRITGNAAVSAHRRETLDLPDNVFGPGASNSFFEGEQIKFRIIGQARPLDWNRIVAGVETEREQISLKQIGGVNARTTGFFLTDRVNIADRLFINAGLRYDDHETFGGQTTYRITGSFQVRETGTRVRGSFSTGFNAPTLVQLFDSFSGNRNLFPEKSDSREIGIDQAALSERLRFGALWFNSDFRDMFGFNPITFQTININSASAEGAEVYAQYSRPDFRARIDYTYTKSTNDADGAQLIRRPKNKISGLASFEPADRVNASLSVTHVGSRDDFNFDVPFPQAPIRVRLDPYTLVALGASYQFSDVWRVFGRVENLFDEEYEEVLFFGTPGRAVYAGFRLSP